MIDLQEMARLISRSVSMLRPLKFFISHFCEHISDYEKKEEDLFHDVSQELNNSVQSSYWQNLSADYFLMWLDCYELFSCYGQHLLHYQKYHFEYFGVDDQSKKTHLP